MKNLYKIVGQQRIPWGPPARGAADTPRPTPGAARRWPGRGAELVSHYLGKKDMHAIPSSFAALGARLRQLCDHLGVDGNELACSSRLWRIGCARI